MEINATKIVKINAKILSIYMKVCDRFCAQLRDESGETLKDYEGYVPDIMPGKHSGDYVILDIDIDTGIIKNWSVPSAKMIEDFIKEGEE